jgi:uracil-DNA glycosylase
MQTSQDHHLRLAESAIAWWRDAGVDYICDATAMDWLASQPAPTAVPSTIDQPVKAAPSRAIETAIAIAPMVATADWPQDLPALQMACTTGMNLPGCHYSNHRIAPLGSTGARVMMISDFPEEAELVARSFGHGPVSALLRNMLLAANVAPDFCFQTALALSRPATGALPKDDMLLLGDFVRHQIALVQPEIVLILGTAACEALLGQDLMRARGSLHYINHDDRKTAAVTTFHPRTLLAQPQLKGKAWQDLQILTRKHCL